MIGSTLNSLIEKLWPMLVIFSATLIIVRIYYLISNHKKIVIYNELINYSFLIYILLLFELVTKEKTGFYGYNLVPFKEIFRYKLFSDLWYQNVLGNILLFIPVGYFIARYAKAKKGAPIILISAIISFTIEMVQRNIGRAFDIDDIILNVVGGFLGYLIYYLIKKLNSRLPSALRTDTFYNILTVIIIVLLVLLYMNNFKLWW